MPKVIQSGDFKIVQHLCSFWLPGGIEEKINYIDGGALGTS